MARSAIRATAATVATAEALDTWLAQQGQASAGDRKNSAAPSPGTPIAVSGADSADPSAGLTGGFGEYPARLEQHAIFRTPGRTPSATAEAMVLPHTDWLFHHLTVAGPAAPIQAFQQAARGAGVIPWQLDLDAMREDLFHMLAAPPAPQSRTLSAAGARILAEDLCVAAGRRQDVANARVGASLACPLDLYSLHPVPAEILRLGPAHPDALIWLWTQWGTTQVLRHVILLGDPAGRLVPEASQRLGFRFWSADWTPWRSLATWRSRWPDLQFELQPRYDAT